MVSILKLPKRIKRRMTQVFVQSAFSQNDGLSAATFHKS